MNSLIQMQAVIEVPYSESKFLCPWEVSELKPFSRIRLSGEMTYPEIDLVFAQLAKSNEIDLASYKQSVLEKILKTNCIVLPSGIQVISEGETIYPSCCCGLETWREWMDFLGLEDSPWLGHDPSPWIERQGDIIRICSDGSIKSKPTSYAFHVDLSRAHFKIALMFVERELQAFLFSKLKI